MSRTELLTLVLISKHVHNFCIFTTFRFRLFYGRTCLIALDNFSNRFFLPNLNYSFTFEQSIDICGSWGSIWTKSCGDCSHPGCGAHYQHHSNKFPGHRCPGSCELRCILHNRFIARAFNRFYTRSRFNSEFSSWVVVDHCETPTSG